MGAFEDSGFNMDVIAAAKTARVALMKHLFLLRMQATLYDTEAAALMGSTVF